MRSAGKTSHICGHVSVCVCVCACACVGLHMYCQVCAFGQSAKRQEATNQSCHVRCKQGSKQTICFKCVPCTI